MQSLRDNLWLQAQCRAGLTAGRNNELRAHGVQASVRHVSGAQTARQQPHVWSQDGLQRSACSSYLCGFNLLLDAGEGKYHL